MQSANTSIDCLFYTSDVEDQYFFQFLGFIPKNDKLVWVLSPNKDHIQIYDENDLTCGKNYYFYFLQDDMKKISQVIREHKSIECNFPVRYRIQTNNGDLEQFIFPLKKISWMSNQSLAFFFQITDIFVKTEIVNEFIQNHLNPSKKDNIQEKMLETAINNIIQEETIQYYYAKEKKEPFASDFLKINQDGQFVCNREAIIRYLQKISSYEEDGFCLQSAPNELQKKAFILQFSDQQAVKFISILPE